MSERQLLVGPFNRVEGDLEIRLDVRDGRVTAAYANSPLFRGFGPACGSPASDGFSACGAQLRSEKAMGFLAEQYAAGVVEPHVDIAQAMLSAPVVTGQIERLLRRAGAFDRHRRLCEQGAALAQVAYALPGVGRVFEQVIGGDAVAAQPVAQTLHAVQMQLQARGGHQHAVADPAAVVQHHLILFRHEGFHP